MIDKETFEKEFEEKYRLAQKAANGDFFKFLQNLGKNPKTDLAGYDLPNYDFSGGDLAGANLRKMNLSSAKFRATNLRGADLSYSDISGADFTDADLTDTNFYHVQAENAIFTNNRGLYERIRLNLMEQGATVLQIAKQEQPTIVVKTKKNHSYTLNSFKNFVISKYFLELFSIPVYETAAIELSQSDNEEDIQEIEDKSSEESDLGFILTLSLL
jgi:hypothetical protein